MRCRAIAAHHGRFPVTLMCRTLAVAIQRSVASAVGTNSGVARISRIAAAAATVRPARQVSAHATFAVTCQLFEDGKELVSFRSMSDLKQKIDYWLPREAERRAIAEAGMRRAHAEHTYALRLGLLLDTLTGTRHGYPTPQIRYAM